MSKITIKQIADKYRVDHSVIIKIAKELKIALVNDKSPLTDAQGKNTREGRKQGLGQKTQTG